jgi:hypothetical protein
MDANSKGSYVRTGRQTEGIGVDQPQGPHVAMPTNRVE